MSLAELSRDVAPKVALRKRVGPEGFVRKKRKARETPVLSKDELARSHRLLKAYLVARKSNLERGRTDQAAKQEVVAIQAHLDYLRNLDEP